MNMVFFAIGILVTLISVIILLCNWSDERTNLLQNRDNIGGFLLGGIVTGIIIFCVPILFFASMEPVITFDTRDTVLKDTVITEVKETYIEYGNQRIPLDDASVKRTTSIPGCYVSIVRKYDLLIGRDEKAEVLISGFRCSEVTSFLGQPQIQTVLAGWNVKVSQLQLPTNMEH